jgi:hypothetical protein
MFIPVDCDSSQRVLTSKPNPIVHPATAAVQRILGRRTRGVAVLQPYLDSSRKRILPPTTGAEVLTAVVSLASLRGALRLRAMMENPRSGRQSLNDGLAGPRLQIGTSPRRSEPVRHHARVLDAVVWWCSDSTVLCLHCIDHTSKRGYQERYFRLRVLVLDDLAADCSGF